MAEVYALQSRISPEGAQRLLTDLRDGIASGRDPGPRGAHIQSLGFSLGHASQSLRSEVERITVDPLTEAPGLGALRAEVLRCCDDLLDFADALARLAAVARSYPI